jgi:tyrosine-protein phosphatase YwqE
MFRLFSKSSTSQKLPFLVDIHSHLLPGLDDGVKSMEETIYILKSLQKLGYQKVITTPHVMSDHYPNTTEDIIIKLAEVKKAVEKSGLRIQLEAAAEYYLDEQLISSLSERKKLLTFHGNYLLFETSFLNKPAFLEEAVFNMNTNGYQPVLAHPERYVYLQSNKQLLQQLKNMNVLFQVNLLSLFGYYSPDIRKSAINLIKSGFVDFIGTDCHNALQADEIVKNISKRRNSLLRSLKVKNMLLI